MDSIVNFNGQIMERHEAQVSVFDRGFLYGDSLYEVIRTYNGVPFLISEHLDRMFESARLADMELDQSKAVLKREIEESIHAFYQRSSQQEDIYCRLIVTRGSGDIGFGKSTVKTPTQYVIIVQSFPRALQLPEKRSTGISLKIASRRRNSPVALDPAMKSGNYLNNLLAFLEAEKDKLDDAILCDIQGFVTEATTSNIFYVRNGIVCTPPLEVGILDGLTRREVLRLARENGIAARESYFTAEQLLAADEVFLSSTLKDVFPVTQIDQTVIGNGKPGPITQKLNQLFLEYVEQQCKKN